MTQAPKRGLALILRPMQLMVWWEAEKRRGMEEGVYQSSCEVTKWDDSALGRNEDRGGGGGGVLLGSACWEEKSNKYMYMYMYVCICV